MPIDPLDEVSTQGGRNMRETCARVLAAALLAGAIATAVGMSALVDTPRETIRPIAAPPSTVQRSVRLTAHIAPRHRARAARLVTAHTSYRAPRSAVLAHRLIVVRTHRAPARPHRRQLASAPAPAAAPAPAPAPGPAPASQSAPAQAAPPADPAPAVPDTSPGPGNHGRGHAYGHDKQDD